MDLINQDFTTHPHMCHLYFKIMRGVDKLGKHVKTYNLKGSLYYLFWPNNELNKLGK